METTIGIATRSHALSPAFLAPLAVDQHAGSKQWCITHNNAQAKLHG